MTAGVRKKTVYDEVVDVTYEYLGPTAERFVTRGIEAHLGKKPHELTKADIAKIHDWSKLALALLTEDKKMVNDFSKSLLAIANRNSH